MKKILAILTSIFLFISALTAAEIAITPYTGIYGVNMASMKYQGGETWMRTSIDSDTFTSETSKNFYCNDHMIALGGVYNLSADEMKEGTSYSITVNCDSDGLYFKSQSHPSSIRPFYLKVIPRYKSSSGDVTGECVLIEDSGKSYPISWDSRSTDSRMWFDLILVLPMDYQPEPNAGFIVAENIQYPMVQADDYTALVTIQLTYNGKSESVIIPFSGYYNGLVDGKKGNDRVSLMFSPTGQAANMTIGNTANVPVGHIDFMMDVTKDNTVHSDAAVRLFLSASNDPTDMSNNGFLFTHSSVITGTVLTDYNSIGYSIILRGEEGRNSGIVTREFDGTEFLDSVDSSANISNAAGIKDNAVYPIRNRTSDADKIVTSNNVREYFEYHGDVEVIIDEPTTIMLPGQYTSNVYIHVVTDENIARDKI